MKLDENYSIEQDQFNWTLICVTEKEVKDKETGLPKIIKSVKTKYPSTLKRALKLYCDEALRPEQSVVDLLTAITRIEAKIDNLKL